MGSFFTEPSKEQTPVTPEQGAQVPRAGFFKSWGYAWDEQVRTAATHGIENEMQKLDRAQWKALKEAGVENAPAVAPHAVTLMNTLIPGPAGDDAYKHENVAKYYAGQTPISLEEQEEIKAYDARIMELREEHPDLNLMTTSEMWATVKQGAKDAEANMAKPRTAGGQVGMFLGGAVASMNPDSDPLNFLTLGVGGPGKTVAQRIGAQGALQGATESINQLTGVQEQRELLDLSHGLKDAATRVGFAVVGGAGFQGIMEGVGAGARRFFRDIPTDPAPPASILADSPPTSRRSAPASRRDFDIPDAPARGDRPSLARSPDTVLAMAREASPHGARAGSRRTESDMEAVAEQLDDWAGPTPSDVRPPGRAATDSRPAEVVARELDPVAFRRIEKAEMRVRDETQALLANPEVPKRTVTSLQRINEELDELHLQRDKGRAAGEVPKAVEEAIAAKNEQAFKLLNRASERLEQEAHQSLLRIAEQAQVRREYKPLVDRAIKRAEGEWDAPRSRQDSGDAPASKSVDDVIENVSAQPKAEAPLRDSRQSDLVDERVKALQEQQTVLDKAIENYRAALAKVSQGDAKVEYAGRELDLDKDTIRVMGQDGEKDITIRELLEDNYKTEQELEAVSTCSIK